MEFKSEKYNTSFTVPDRPTVRQQMAYLSTAGRARDREYVEKLWLAACDLLSDWKSELLPDCRMDLEKLDNPKVTDLIIWASFEVKKYIDGLDLTPKN